MGLTNAIPSPDQFKQMQASLAALPAPQLATPNMGGGLPAISAPVMPSVTASLGTPSSAPTPDAQILRDQTKISDLRTSGAGVTQIHNPFLRGLAEAGDIASQVAGSAFYPAHVLAAAIPGTTLHHNLLVNQAQRNLANDQETQQKQQLVADEQAQAKQRQSLADKYDAQSDDLAPFTMTPAQAAVLNHPELAGTATTMRDFRAALVGAGHDTTSAANNTRTNDTRQSISDDKLEAAAKTAAAKPEQRDDHYIAIMAKPPASRTPDDLAYKQGYEGYIKAKMTDPRVAGALARPLQVVLPSGQAGYETAGTAIKTGAQGLGDNTYKAQGAALRDFTSGTDAHTLTAFNTAKGHLQQLAIAGDALQNGDVQALNKLANAYGTATGNSAPVVFQGVKTAVSGEIAKAFTGAGATVDEINEIRKSIDDANSPEQLHDVVNSYSHLLDTKSGVLRDQFSAAKRGQANFGDTVPAGVQYARDPQGNLHQAPAGTPLPPGWKAGK